MKRLEMLPSILNILSIIIELSSPILVVFIQATNLFHRLQKPIGLDND